MTTRQARTTRRIAAFGLAAVATLATLAGVHQLAAQPAFEAQMAQQHDARTQVVVIEAKRSVRS